MANMEEFIFRVEAQTQDAVNKLQQISKLMDDIERVRNKARDNYDTTNQKDMVRSMRTMAEITDQYTRARRELIRIQNELRDKFTSTAQIEQGLPKGEIDKINDLQKTMNNYFQQARRQQQELQRNYQRTLSKFRELSTYQQNYSKNFVSRFSTDDVYNFPVEYRTVRRTVKDSEGRPRTILDPKTGERTPLQIEEQELDYTRARQAVDGIIDNLDDHEKAMKEIDAAFKAARNLDRRMESQYRRAQASGYMSFQQASNFRGDYVTATTEFEDFDERNRQRMAELGVQRSLLQEELKSIEQDPTAANDPRNIDRKVRIDRNIESITKEMKRREELSRVMSEVIQNAERRNRQLQEAPPEVKPERGTMRGMMYERAPSFGLAVTGAVGLAVGGLFARGLSLERSARDQVISIGQRTGQEYWREDVRDRAMDLGLEDRLGFSLQETLQFADTYLSERGIRSEADLETATRSQAEFSRVTGLTADTTTDFFRGMFDSAVLTGNSVRDIQNAFVGGIKESGMEGREEDQLKALEALVGEVSQGRVLREQDVLNLMGMQTILNASGHESLRGSRGMEMLSDLNQGIRQSVDDPFMRVLFGYGTEHVGLGGLWDVSQQLEKGVSDPANVERIFNIARTFSGEGATDKEIQAVAYRLIRGNMGVDITSEQLAGLYDLSEQGALSEENIDKVLENTMRVGEQESEERLDRYREQAEATANQSEAVTERQAIQLSDMADVVRVVNQSLGGMPPTIYATIAALTAFTGTLLSSLGSYMVGERARRWASRSYRNFDDSGRRGFRGRIQDMLSPKGPGGGGGLGDLFSPWIDPNVKKGGLPNRGPQTEQSGKGRGIFPSSFSDILDKSRAGLGKITDWFRNRGGPGGGGGRLGLIDTPGGLGSLGRGGGLGNVLGRAFMPISALSGLGVIMGAPEGEKAQATGEVVGGLAGGLGGGAALGAAVGSVIPGLGTAIGGMLGGILGSAGGSAIGGWIGDLVGNVGSWIADTSKSIAGWFGNLFKSGEPPKPEQVVPEVQAKPKLDNAYHERTGEPTQISDLVNRRSPEGWMGNVTHLLGGYDYYRSSGDNSEQSILDSSTGLGTLGDQMGYEPRDKVFEDNQNVNKIREQLERENTVRKEQTEQRREDNIAEERVNLDRMEDILKRASQILYEARMQNGIFGTPMGTGMSDAASILSGNSNAEKIWNFFAQKGFAPGAIAGILGNLQQESGLDPTATNPSSGAFGIAQWLGGRKQNLMNFARQRGMDPNSLEAQLEFMWHELQQGTDSRVNLSSFKKINDPVKAANIFERDYERSGGSAMGKRRQYARDFYNQLSTMKVESTINVNLNSRESVSDQVVNSSSLSNMARRIQEKIFGSMNYYSRDMRRA